MDQKISRWSQLVWMDADKVTELHRRETLWATRSEKSRRLKFEEKGLPHWMDLRWIATETMRISPDGYWPRDMTPSEQSSSLAQFESLIYPIWKGVEERDFDREAKLSQQEVNAQRVLLECLTLHHQDLLIHASGKRPTRTSSNYAQALELRRKAAKSERGVYER